MLINRILDQQIKKTHLAPDYTNRDSLGFFKQVNCHTHISGLYGGIVCNKATIMDVS